MMELWQLVIKALVEHPEEWKQGFHTLRNSRTGMELWSANTRWDCCVYHISSEDHSKADFPLFKRAKVWRAMQRVLEHNAKQVLLGE